MNRRPYTSGSLRSGWGDGLAVGASALCLLHCLALPVALAALPGLAAYLSTPKWTHAALLALALPLSVKMLVAGFRRHGRALPIIIGTIGIAAMAVGVVFEEVRLLEAGLTVAGSTLVAVAHLRNWRLMASADRSQGTTPMLERPIL